MKQTNAFWQFVFLALALTLCFIFFIFFLVWLQLDAEQTLFFRSILHQNIYYLLALITIVPVALWVIFEMCYTRFYLPLKKIPAETSVIYRTNPSHRLDFNGNHNIRELCAAINGFAEVYENLAQNIAREIGAARSETEKERNLLASIMAELPVGLIICNINGRILLFNSQARMVFTRNRTARRSEYFLGLGRSIFHIIDKSLIVHALDEIEERLAGDKSRVASSFITQLEEDVLLHAETIPVLSEERKITGFILSLQDISENIERYESINRSLLSFGRDLRKSLLLTEEHLTNTLRDREDDCRRAQECFAALGKKFDFTCSSVLDRAFETMPLTRIDLQRFLILIQKSAGEKNIRVNVTTTSSGKRILGDTFSFAAAIGYIVEKLNALTSLDEFDLMAAAQGNQVVFEFSWGSSSISPLEVDKMVSEKITPLTNLGYVLKQNRASLQAVADRDGKCSLVRITAKSELASPSYTDRGPVIAGSRPEYYDFNLFTVDDENRDLLDTSLASLTYSVIDTETTGLDPGNDEIISIGAVRIVQNRIVHEDRFEQLINPSRDIPFESYKIHGIEPDMVRDKPVIDEILPEFKNYIADSVIVGHDVGFDLKMIKMKEKSSGVVLTNPVLDTLLLSAMLHPIHKQHNIESVAKRLGVTIVGRHTALGDALAAAEIFLKLLPILQSKGIFTLKDAIEASKRTFFLRLRY